MKKAVEIGELLKDTDEMKALAEATAAYEKDVELIALVEKYNSLCAVMADVPEDDAVARSRFATEITELHGQIMQNASMLSYMQAKQLADRLTEDVIDTISRTIVGDSGCHDGCDGDCSHCGHRH